MKIFHLIHKPQNRGAETFACQLANHQKKLGHEVKIGAIYSGHAELYWNEPIENFKGEEGKFLDWKAWKKLAKFVKEFQPDIVQANSGDTLKYAVFSKKVYGWKTPIIFRNASEVGRYLRSGLHQRLNSFLYRNVAGVVSVSMASANDLLHYFPTLQDKTHVIPVGLEEKKPELKILWPKSQKHVVHVGGFSFEKNHQGLLSIFKKVLEVNPLAHLHLIGDGNLRHIVEDLVKKHKIQENVSFYGFVNNPLDFIKAADVLVLPSSIEGLPGVLLEAMYCKTPVVAYDVGGISEIVNQDTGFLIQKGNERKFADAVLQNLDQPNHCLIEKAYKMVRTNFMNKKLTKEFFKFYEKVIR